MRAAFVCLGLFRRVALCLRPTQARAVLRRPLPKRIQHGTQRLAQIGEPVFHLRRHGGMHAAADQPGGFQRAKLLGQLLLGDQRNGAGEFGEAQRLARG